MLKTVSHFQLTTNVSSSAFKKNVSLLDSNELQQQRIFVQQGQGKYLYPTTWRKVSLSNKDKVSIFIQQQGGKYLCPSTHTSSINQFLGLEVSHQLLLKFPQVILFCN